MLFFHKRHKEGLVLLVIPQKNSQTHCWKKITLQQAVQFISGQMLTTHSTSHGTVMTGHVLQWTDPPRGFHHTLIIFPGVSCFITVCCHTPQPTSRVTQIVLTSYSLGFFSKKLIHHLCNGRGNIFIFHTVVVIPEGFVSEKKYYSFLRKISRMLLLSKTKGNLHFRHWVMGQPPRTQHLPSLHRAGAAQNEVYLAEGISFTQGNVSTICRLPFPNAPPHFPSITRSTICLLVSPNPFHVLLNA